MKAFVFVCLCVVGLCYGQQFQGGLGGGMGGNPLGGGLGGLDLGVAGVGMRGPEHRGSPQQQQQQQQQQPQERGLPEGPIFSSDGRKVGEPKGTPTPPQITPPTTTTPPSKKIGGVIDYEQYVKPIPDPTERTKKDEGEHEPFMLDGRKLLVVAALTKNWDMFAWGLQQGVDINDVDNSGMGLLSILLSLGAEEDVLEEVVKKGADPRIKDNAGRSLVHHAVLSKKMKLIEFVLDRLKMDSSPQDDDGNTPLHYAAATGQPVLVMRLLDKWGADVNATNSLDRNALHLVCGHSNITQQFSVYIFGVLFRHQIDKTLRSDSDGNTPLHLCAVAGHEPLIKALLKHTDQSSVANKRGYTPAMMAMLSNHFTVAQQTYKKNYAPLETWSVVNVGEYLLFELGRIPIPTRVDLLQRFYVYGVDGQVLKSLTVRELEDMEIVSPRSQEVILSLFKELISSGPGKPPTEEELKHLQQQQGQRKEEL